MKKILFLTGILILLSHILFGQCPNNLNGPNDNNNPITIYVYNSTFQVIDSIICNQSGQSGNINCNNSQINSSNGTYFSITGYSCIYDSSGNILPDIFLSVELFSFTGRQIKDYNMLEWVTASEVNNDYFILERSSDGENWDKINYTPGARNSSQNISYSFRDYTFENKLNYYKLTQVDYDDAMKSFNVIFINNTKEPKVLIKTVNLMGQDVDEYYIGFVINIYSDGTTNKELK